MEIAYIAFPAEILPQRQNSWVGVDIRMNTYIYILHDYLFEDEYTKYISLYISIEIYIEL